MRRTIQLVLGLVIALGLAAFTGGEAKAQGADPRLPRMFYYPYQYFPHNYAPSMGPKWPEGPGQPYMPPPAYMAYPPYKVPNWIDMQQRSQRFHSGGHFWLDVF